MRYEGTVYRPPSEARSLIIQVTIGCARNTCTFCSMYKDKNFRIRDINEVVEDLETARDYYGSEIERVFLADGDALILPTKDILFILNKVKSIFTNVKRITMYAAPKDILIKTDEELKSIKDAGLDMVYVGAESGDDTVLKDVKKGVSADEIIQAGIKIKKAGIKLSMTLISGLGGKPRLKEHALNSAKLISSIKPEYVGFLTLMLEEGTPLYTQYKKGEFQLLTAKEVVEEMRIFLTNVDSQGTVFRSNHASNYISLAGDLNKDIDNMLKYLDEAEKRKAYKPEGFRGL